jgi:hypothetical protein
MEVKRKKREVQLACSSADPFVSRVMSCQDPLESMVLKDQGRIALIPVTSQKSINAGYSSSP